MKTKITLLLALVLLYSCNQPARQTKEINDPDAIEKQLKSMAAEFLKSWEPPFSPEKALSFFTQGNDFHLVSDGHETMHYSDWAEMVPRWMTHDRNTYSSYIHEITNTETVVLSPESGVVTAVYIWDSVTREGVHERVHGAITLACRHEPGGWKIVHYHGSHYTP